MRLSTCILILCVALLPLNAAAADKSHKQRPAWLSSLPKPKTPSYTFVEADASGATLEAARQLALINLAAKLEHERGLSVTNTVTANERMSRSESNRSNINETFTMECRERGRDITLTARVIDEYWEYKNGRYTVYNLYTVKNNALAGGSYDDDIKVTDRYGVTPMFYSIIPGVGQIYKGSGLKGGLIMGGTVVGAVAIVLCENQRSSYVKKRTEYPQHIDFYNNRVSEWETGRNVAIGATAALYIYNLIDAAVAPGRRHVVVKKRAYSYSLVPTAIDGNPALAFTLNF